MQLFTIIEELMLRKRKKRSKACKVEKVNTRDSIT